MCTWEAVLCVAAHIRKGVAPSAAADEESPARILHAVGEA